MKQPSLKLGAIIGGLTSLPLMALFYLGEQLAGLPFVPFDIFDWLARVLPGDIITLAIDAIVTIVGILNLGSTSDVAKAIEQVSALLMFAAVGVLLGAVIAWTIGRIRRPGWQLGAFVSLIVFLAVLYIEFDLGFVTNSFLTIMYLGALILSWGALVGLLLTREQAKELTEDSRAARRDLLLKLAGGSLGVAVGAWGLGRLAGTQNQDIGAGEALGEVASPATPAPQTQATKLPNLTASATMRDSVEPAPGTRPELTANEDFYRIDINTRPVKLDEESWQLEVDGLFDNPRNLTLDDLRAYPSVTQTLTLGCISNRVGGDLIGTSNWTGVRLRDVLADLGIRPEAKELSVEAADGFFESVTMQDLMDPRTLLVYGMNGQTLPVEHGFPLRIYIPNRYGMKQPKWISRITAIDEKGSGYWVVRGWSQEARPQIVSVIDSVSVNEPTADGLIPIGGIAWAGDRGIEKVELQLDDDQWVEATLRTPPLSPLTWVQWRYDWSATPGSHRIRVRATDGTGQLQVEEEQGVRPDGATGYHSRQARI
jgi:DMSO/TMAO reductase YedYZ molybdopterin-dependent catalytic subunit